MSRIAKFSFAALLLIGFAQILIFAPQTLEETEELKAPPTTSKGGPQNGRMIGEQLAEGVHWVEAGEDGKDWELFAEQAKGSQGQERWELETVKVVFHTSSNVTFTVTGREGRFQWLTKDMEINGDVVVVSSNGYTFTTDQVNYLGQERLIQSPGKVQIRGPKDIDGQRLNIQGGNMTANMNTSKVNIAGSVFASKTLSEGQRLSVNSQQANISGKSFETEFHGRVRLQFNEILAKGPKAVFHIDPKTKRIVSVDMGGGVALEKEGATATSKELNVDVGGDRIELRGYPVLKQGKDEIVGDTIVFLQGGKRVRVEDARARVRQEGSVTGGSPNGGAPK